MAKFEKSFMEARGLLPKATDEDKPVPVEVKCVVWVKRAAWEEEFSMQYAVGEDFETVVRDWVIAEMQETFVEQGEWSNVTEVTE